MPLNILSGGGSSGDDVLGPLSAKLEYRYFTYEDLISFFNKLNWKIFRNISDENSYGWKKYVASKSGFKIRPPSKAFF